MELTAEKLQELYGAAVQQEANALGTFQRQQGARLLMETLIEMQKQPDPKPETEPENKPAE